MLTSSLPGRCASSAARAAVRRAARRCVAASASAAAADSPRLALLASESGVVLQRRVYIEHTDCVRSPPNTAGVALRSQLTPACQFGVVFYAQYWRWLAQAREVALRGLEQRPSSVPRPSSPRPSSVRTIQLNRGRLSSPARLGDSLVVTSRLVGRNKHALFWQQSVGPPGAAKPHLTCEAVTTHSGDALFDALPLLADDIDLPPLSFLAADVLVSTEVELTDDELNGHAASPSEADVLRWFERNRTDAIGGGSGLAELQKAGVLVVVTALDEFRLCSAAEWGSGSVTVRSRVTVKRRGMLIRFDQTVSDSAGALLARGKVTCACVDARTMSLTEAPPALLARLTADIASV